MTGLSTRPVTWLILTGVFVLLAGCGESHKETPLTDLKAHDTAAMKIRNDVRRSTTTVDYERGTLATLPRKKHIEKYPCSNCHVSGFDGETKQKPSERRAHWDLEINHGDDLTCSSCHFEDDVDLLKTLRGDTVPYNRSYRICGQCHFEQLRDWKGGAHGKQVKGWDKPRVIYNCSTCHDPHDPAYEKRWPVTYPSVPRTANDNGS